MALTLLPTLNMTCEAMLAYAAKILVPAFMSASYSWSKYPNVSVRGLFGATLVVSLIWVAMRLSGSQDRNHRLIAFGIFWYFIALIPVSNLVPTSTQMADRYLFVPSVGAILALLSPWPVHIRALHAIREWYQVRFQFLFTAETIASGIGFDFGSVQRHPLADWRLSPSRLLRSGYVNWRASRCNTTASVTQFQYDTKGELTQITDPLQNVTKLTYTPAGLIASITDAQNHVTSYQYDTRSNRTAVIDPINGASHPPASPTTS